MGAHHSGSPVLTRSALTLFAVLSAAACGQEALIGETFGPDDDPSGGPAGGGLDWGDDCYQRSELNALPDREPSYTESPAEWVGGARGRWVSAAGDTLDVTIDTPATRVEFSCYEAPDVQPAVSFMLAGRISLRTADGAWDETLVVSFGLSELPSGASDFTVLSASGELDVTALHGSFKLPPNLQRPAEQLVQLKLEYQDDSWILDRTVGVDRSKPSAACRCPGDAEPAWSPPQVTFTRAPTPAKSAD